MATGIGSILVLILQVLKALPAIFKAIKSIADANKRAKNKKEWDDFEDKFKKDVEKK